jgi:hypothetical protein
MAKKQHQRILSGFPTQKRFRDKSYHRYSIRNTAEAAMRDAKEYRKMGGLARIIKYPTTLSSGIRFTFHVVFVWG